MELLPFDHGIGLPDIAGHSAIGLDHPFDQGPQWPIDHDAFDIATLSEAQISNAFASAMSSPRDTDAMALRQELWAMATAHATSRSAPSTTRQAGLIQTSPSAGDGARKREARRLVAAPAELPAMLAAFRAKVLAATSDPGTTNTLVDTLKVMVLFSKNSGTANRPAGQANSEALIREF